MMLQMEGCPDPLLPERHIHTLGQSPPACEKRLTFFIIRNQVKRTWECQLNVDSISHSSVEFFYAPQIKFLLCSPNQIVRSH